MDSDKYITSKLEEKDFPLWDNFVRGSVQGTIFNMSLWLKTLANLLRREFSIIVCRQGGEIVGGCGIFIEKTLEGRAAKFAPLTAYNGFIVSQSESDYGYKSERHCHGVSFNLIDYIEDNFDCAILTHHPQYTDVRPFIWRGWDARVCYTYYQGKDFALPLSRDVYRRAEIAKDGGVSIDEDLNCEEFYDIWSKTFIRQNIKVPMEKTCFLELLNKLEGARIVKPLVARDKSGKILSGVILLEDKDKIFYWLAANHSDSPQTGASQLLIRFIIENLSDKYQIIDFVGADVRGIAAYKSTFGVRLVPHYSVSKAFTTRGKIVRAAKYMRHNFMTK